jgi:hypothetical protein
MEMGVVTELKVKVGTTSLDFTPTDLVVPFVVGTLSNQVFFAVVMAFLFCTSMAYVLEYFYFEIQPKKHTSSESVSPLCQHRIVTRDAPPSTVEHGVGSLTRSSMLVEKALPHMYHSSVEKRTWCLVWNEMLHHQKWIVFAKMVVCLSPFGDASTMVDVCQKTVLIAADILTALTFLTLIYIFYDDTALHNNGWCLQFENSDSCSIPNVAGLNILGNTCVWRYEDSSCVMRTPTSGLWSIIVASCLTGFLSAPVAAFIRWLFEEYVMARTERRDDLHVYKNSGLMQFVPPFIVEWVITHQTVQSFGSTFQTLKKYGLNTAMQSVMKCSKSDCAVLNRKVCEHSTTLRSVKEKELFLRNWGVAHDNSRHVNVIGDYGGGEMCGNVNKGMFSFTRKEKKSADIILNELCRANICAMHEKREILQNLQHELEPLEEIRVLRLLIGDLLSDDECSIFVAKCHSENRCGHLLVNPKSMSAKMLASVIVGLYCVLGSSIVYYFGITRDSQSQLLWSVSFFIWILFDMLVIQSVFVVMKEVWVPSVIGQRLIDVKALLVRCICELDTYDSADDKFKWSLMLFSSAKVASKYYASRLGELLLALSLDVPRRSKDISSYSRKAILMLNVRNCHSFSLIARKNNNWNTSSSLFTRTLSILVTLPLVSSVTFSTFSALFSCFAVMILTWSFYLHGALIAILVVTAFFLAFAAMFQASCWRKLSTTRYSRIDKEEQMLKLLGGKAYRPKGTQVDDKYQWNRKKKLVIEPCFQSSYDKVNDPSLTMRRVSSCNISCSSSTEESSSSLSSSLMSSSIYSDQSERSEVSTHIFIQPSVVSVTRREYAVDEQELVIEEMSSYEGSSNSAGEEWSSDYSSDVPVVNKNNWIEDSPSIGFSSQLQHMVVSDTQDLNERDMPMNSSLVGIEFDEYSKGHQSIDDVVNVTELSSTVAINIKRSSAPFTNQPSSSACKVGVFTHENSEHSSAARQKVLSAIRQLRQLPEEESFDDHSANNLFVNAINKLDTQSPKDKFKPKRHVPKELESMLFGKSAEEKLRILFHLADQTGTVMVSGQNDSSTIFQQKKSVSLAKEQVIEGVIKRKLKQDFRLKHAKNKVSTTSFPTGIHDWDSDLIFHRSVNTPFTGLLDEERRILGCSHRHNNISNLTNASSVASSADFSLKDSFPVQDVLDKDNNGAEGRSEYENFGRDSIYTDVDIDATSSVDDRLQVFSEVIDELEVVRLKRLRRKKNKQIKNEGLHHNR